MIKVSIILPVYNTKDYLEKCLESIINQTLREIEVIVVNDGSLDDSQLVIDEFVKKDNRIKAFVKENTGLSDTRNFGMKKAKGKYIWFIDSDDYLINEEACEKFYNLAEENNLDIVTCNYISENKKGNSIIVKKSEKLLNNIYDGKTYLKGSYKTGWYIKMVWLNFYNRSFLENNNLKFEVGRVHEDWLFTPVAFLKAQRILCIADCFYYYNYNCKSITKSKFNPQNAIDKIYLMSKLKKVCDEQDDIELKKLLYNDVIGNYLYSIFLLKHHKENYKEWENDNILKNAECSKKNEYRIVLYRKSNFLYFYIYEIYNFIKKMVFKK